MGFDSLKLVEQKNKLKDMIDRKNILVEEISQLDYVDEKAIIDAIIKQRFYYIKNNSKVIFDKFTGLLWTNPYNFPYKKNDNTLYSNKKLLSQYENGYAGLQNWRFPAPNEIWHLFKNLSPTKALWGIFEVDNKFVSTIKKPVYGNGSISDYDLGDPWGNSYGYIILCNETVAKQNDYANYSGEENNVFTEKEKAQKMIEIMVKNQYLPVFDDAAVTKLFDDYYYLKPKKQEEVLRLSEEIKELQNNAKLTIDFDYIPLLEKYDLEAIQGSVIKYYQAVQSWTEEMLTKLDDYEKGNAETIATLNSITVNLFRKYTINDSLSIEENEFLKKRQDFFRKKMALGIAGVKRQILSFKHQADAIEDRIEEINDGDNSLIELGELEREKRVTFPLLAENTAIIIKKALETLAFFKSHQQFIQEAVNTWEEWSKDYLNLKVTGQAQLRSMCEEDGIEEEIWQSWFNEWVKIRFKIETKLQPLIERGLEGDISVIKNDNIIVITKLIGVLRTYKKDIDNVYIEERKGIHQNFCFQAGGDLQEKFETELRLYRCTTKLQDELQCIIFNCEEPEDRIFVLEWAKDLLNIQVDELLTYISDKKLDQISKKVLDEFIRLRLNNFDAYLNDAKAYGLEKARREKEFNSLMFKIRKETMKK